MSTDRVSSESSYLPSPFEKKKYVQNMFDKVASRYDFLNHFLSLGIDFYWRHQALKLINFNMNPRLLDLATGTGDIAVMAVKRGARKVVGVDLSFNMLRVGNKKIIKKDVADSIAMVCGEGENLPLPNESMDAATIAFGIRNVEDIQKTLNEMARVLTNSGVIVVLEFSKPTWPVIKQLYQFYFLYVLPRIGSMISSDKEAYHYLPHSVLNFPERGDFVNVMKQSGFTDVRVFDMSFGIVTAYCGIKL
ncbi:bifunctional demethylmenaquinone methyltransferase/2-methoxy-6-polyprenyl-1,4-benzoquinol methylase UbiE [bacterium]|nr:MAG: bifunctional demethylmenaquinone methyltransferase/2-methoxy-6-polyprenyl-1,4-benzoquinol methylase UbiE [bacterium]